jgi:hypothetical protein
LFGEEALRNKGRRRHDKIYSELTACQHTTREQGDIDALITAEADYFIYVPN